MNTETKIDAPEMTAEQAYEILADTIEDRLFRLESHDDSANTIMANLKALVELDELKDELEALGKKVAAKIKSLSREDGPIWNAFLEGMDKTTVLGRTVYLHRIADPKILDKFALIKTLKVEGAGIVTEGVNLNTLGAWMREFPNGEDGLPQIPDAYKGCLEASLRVSVRVKSS